MLYKWNTFISVFIFLAFGLYYLVKKKSDWYVYSFLMLSFLSGMLITLFPDPIYLENLGDKSNNALMLVVNEMMLTTLIPIVFIFSIPKEKINLFIDLFCISGLISALLTIINGIANYPMINYNFGFMTNTSVEGTYLAIIAPILFFKKDVLFGISENLKIILSLILSIAILITTSSIGIGGLLLGIYFYLLIRKKWIYISIPTLIAIVAVILYHDQIFYAEGRFKIIAFQYDAFFRAYIDPWTGSGFGTYGAIGPWLQKVFHFPVINGKYYSYPNMHSDFFQIFFEMGIIGGVIVILIYLKLVIINLYDKRFWLLTSIIVYGAVSVLNMPARYLPSACLGLLLLRSTYVRCGI